MNDRKASYAHIAAAALLSVLLSACVTTTSGGFNVDESPEQALQDYLALARGYLDQGDLANAKRHLANAAGIDSNNAEIYSIRGLVLAREGENAAADESFQRSLRLDRNNSQTRNNYAAFLFSLGRYEEAYDHLEIVVRDIGYVSRPQAFENLGMSALRLNRLEEAEYAFSRAVQLNANQVRSILELASINLIKGNLTEAEKFYRNYLTILQYFNVRQSARSLWIGIQIELGKGNEAGMLAYGARLASEYADSPEHLLYRELLKDRNND